MAGNVVEGRVGHSFAVRSFVRGSRRLPEEVASQSSSGRSFYGGHKRYLLISLPYGKVAYRFFT